MRKKKTSSKTYNIDTPVPYDNAMYEHEHKENHHKDLLERKGEIIREKYDDLVMRMLKNGLMDNRH